MKAIRSTIFLASLAFGAAAPAHAQPIEPTSTSTPLKGETMTTKEKIQQLKPATNFVELMQLLNNIHEQVLLIDPYFMEDENIFRLFGAGMVQERTDPDGQYVFKKFIANEGYPTQFRVSLMGRKKPPGYGSLTLGNYSDALPFNYEIIEAHLLPDVQGEDPYAPRKPMTNEARNRAGGRPLATHPKGYWEYFTRNKTADHMADIYVVLDRDAKALHIDFTQKGFKK